MRRTIPVLKLFGKKVPLPSEAAEFAVLDKAIRDITILESLPSNVHVPSHPLSQIQDLLKPTLSTIPDQQVHDKFQHIQQVLAQECQSYQDKLQSTIPLTIEEEEANGTLWKEHKETLFRLIFGQSYFKSLETLVKNQEVNSEITSTRMRRLVDSVLVGTSSERLQEHMQLFGDSLDEETLQICFYAIYEAEIESTNKLLAMYPTKLERHKKKLAKLSTDFLLDKLELNVKARCVLAWSDPNYGGFKPLPDGFQMPITELLKGRHTYFKEGATMGRTYLTSVKGTVTEYYDKKKDRKDLMKKGAVFFLITCILDYIVCTL